MLQRERLARRKNSKRVPRKEMVNRLVKKIEDTGSTSRQSGSGRPRTACTDENKDNVEDMIQSQEDLPGTHHPQRKMARELGVSQSSVICIQTGS